MNKGEFVKAIAQKADMTNKDAEIAWNAVEAVIVETLKNGDKINIVGFGVFEGRHRPERAGINPATKAKITIAASVSPNFKAGKSFKDALNNR